MARRGAAPPTLQSFSELLQELGRPHLCVVLGREHLLGNAELCSADRLAFMRRLKSLGIASLGDRQAVANGLMRAHRHGRVARPPDHKAARIAFLFLSYEGLPHEALWRCFFDPADPELYGVYIHSKVPSPQSAAAGCHIATVPTEYGKYGIVDAELALLREALADGRNSKFVLCSDACVPLKSFAYVHRVLASDGNAHFAEFDEARGVFASRLSPLLEVDVQPTCFAKHSQWWVLNRRVATLAVSQPADILRAWQQCEVPDEHYFLTTVRRDHAETADDFWDADAPTTPRDVVCHSAQSAGDFCFPTHVCWSRAERSAPVDWNGEPALRPCTYTAVTAAQLSALVSSPACFGRKFAADCQGLDSLREVYAAVAVASDSHSTFCTSTCDLAVPTKPQRGEWTEVLT